MTKKNIEKNKLIIKVSSLYYIAGLNQQEIADKLRISRPQISRMLSSARADGIVNISIKNPYAKEQEYESKIAEQFGLHDVVVIDTSESELKLIERELARTAVVLLESMLKDHDTVGIMAGRSVCAVAEEIDYFPRKGLSFAPLVGGWGPEGSNWHANSNARMLGEKLKSTYWQLNAPAVVASEKSREVLLNEPDIANVLNIARNSTIALVGIGQVSNESTIAKTGFFDVNDIEEVKMNGAIANVCASFINDKGECIDFSASTRMIGVTAAELKKTCEVVAIACGANKVQAITATLRGGWVNVLITDLNTAKGILDWNCSHPVN